MDVPLEISFRGMDPSPGVESLVRERAAKLDRYFPHLTSCRVTIDAPHRHHQKGNVYHVTVELGVPSQAHLVVSRDPEINPAHKDALVAVRDAFDKVQRRLQDAAEKLEGKTKRKNPPDISAG